MKQGFKDRMQQSSMNDKAMPNDETWNKIQKKLKRQKRRDRWISSGLIISTIVAVLFILIIAFLMMHYAKIKSESQPEIKPQNNIEQPDSLNLKRFPKR